VDSPALEAVPLPPDALPAQVGRYRIEGEIARGGMGLVLRAHDDTFNRTVAFKVLQQPQASPDAGRRFREEAQLMGQLQHPGIPPVHDLGTLPDGRPFFALKLIKGRTLAELLKERLSPSDALPHFLAMFGQVCQTVAYAHSRGILHRDLKPSNVMVGAFGEVQLMDWGLAKVLGQQRATDTAIQTEELSTIYTARMAGDVPSTQAGTVMGTPAYMAPEQARGEIDHLDERCDVFGLGALLCVLLTGQPPYVGPKAELRRQAAQAQLAEAFARLDGCGADAELVTLAKACLAPERGERPCHAGEVADYVAAYEAQVRQRLQQAQVARAQAEVQVREEGKRRRLAWVLATVLLLLVVGAGAAAVWYQQQQAAHAVQLARAEAEITSALGEAAKLAERATTLTDNLPSWQATLTAALSAVKRAEALLDQEPELATEGRVQQVRQLRARLEADQKDWQLLAVYDQVRLEQSQWDLTRRRFKLGESYPRLQQALADYGLAIGSLEPGQAVERLRQRPLALQKHVLAVLEECLARAPKEQGAQRQWLAAVLAMEADPWLKQFRQAVTKRAWAQIGKLAAQAGVDRYHPAVLVGLARNLPEAAWASKVLLLRRTQQQYPGDFWVNLELGGALYDSVFPSGSDRAARAEELPVVTEAVVFGRVAVGLRPGNATAHINLGVALAAQGDVKEAMACYHKALILDPKHVLAHYNLGIELYATKDVAGAIACYQKTLDLDPRYAPAHTNLGLALRAQGDLKGAIACYKKALTLDPKLVQAHNNLGWTLQAQGDVSGAVACYHKALDLDPKYALAHINLGNALQAQGDLKGAIACYTKALALDPKDALAHYNLGNALYDQGDVVGAIACYRKALDLDPKEAKTHGNLGLALQAQGDVKGAIACYRQALTLDPKYAHAHNKLGVALQAQGDVKGAMACYKKALALDPMYAQAHSNLGQALQAQGDVKGAIECYRKALDLDPKYAKGHNNLGHALQTQGDLKGASAHYQKALDFDPKYVKAHNNLGTALAAQGDVKGAIACYKRALILDPKYASAHTNLGKALQAQGDVKGAIACYQKALALDPKEAKAHTNLGVALHEQGEVKGAIACYQKALELDPKLVQAHTNLGNALKAQGNLKGAIACYHKALALDPNYANAHGALGRALLAQGAFQEARVATQKALDLLPKGHPLRSLATRQLQECQRLLELDRRLPALLQGDAQPQDSAEQLALADLCQRYKKRYAVAARFYTDAFATQPKLTPQEQALHRYNAACCAALAAEGKGEDAAKLDKERTRLRQQALAWLRDSLQHYGEKLEDADAKTRTTIQQTLQHWQKDSDLDSVRGKEALAQLPAAERAAWQQLWNDVATLLNKTGAKP
jgi:tetratricopeptide (TPR) repeat protein